MHIDPEYVCNDRIFFLCYIVLYKRMDVHLARCYCLCLHILLVLQSPPERARGAIQMEEPHMFKLQVPVCIQIRMH